MQVEFKPEALDELEKLDPVIAQRILTKTTKKEGGFMSAALPLDQMSTEEKLIAMEELWADLSRNQEQFESPRWHEEVLKEREERVKEGLERPIDWEEAKEDLRQRFTCF